MRNLDIYYQILELDRNASLPDVRKKYRILIKVWHPDRFANDPSVRMEAEDKLKQINAAYEVLSDYLTGRRVPPQEEPWQAPPPEPPPNPPRGRPAEHYAASNQKPPVREGKSISSFPNLFFLLLCGFQALSLAIMNGRGQIDLSILSLMWGPIISFLISLLSQR
jgi:hypothetical protein